MAEKHRPEWFDTLQDFWRIKNKFSQNADLIRRVMAKVNKDVVEPLVAENTALKAQVEMLRLALARMTPLAESAKLFEEEQKWIDEANNILNQTKTAI